METEAEVAYMAAMIDGEGCIDISRRMATGGINPSYRLQVIISNDALPMLQELQKVWGGRIHPSSNKNRCCFNLRISATESKYMLNKCLPFMKVKRGQACDALSAFEYDGPDVFKFREAVFQRLKHRRLDGMGHSRKSKTGRPTTRDWSHIEGTT